MSLLEHFLNRMVAPGNFLAVAFKGKKGLGHRFFPRHDVADAASFLHWASDAARLETWYALASYNTATQHTDAKNQREYYRGARTQDNAAALKTFWFDADIKRAGDGKDPSKVFADLQEAVRWVKGFAAATGIPLPNVWVRSGYGIHVYWSFADALARAHWQPYAEALKNALAAHHAKGDLGVVADAARILRPVGTFNYKDPANPAPCYLMIDQPDYANAALLPRLGVVPTTSSAPSPSRPTRPGTMAANAKAGLRAQPRSFSEIALHCAQVRQSLQEGGAQDGRQLWHGLLTLAFFCENARAWSHSVGDQHPQYTEAGTDAEVDRIEAEHAKKSFGPTLCATFDAERPGVCGQCPHHHKVTSPWQLSNWTSPDALPPGFRHNAGWLEREHDGEWHRFLQGNLRDPRLDVIDDRNRLSFTFDRCDGRSIPIVAFQDAINHRTGRELFCVQGVNLHMYNWRPFVDVILAWIDKLLAACQQRDDPLPSFGWQVEDGNYLGFSVGGVFYGADGSETPALGADKTLLRRYRPGGFFPDWQKAATFVAADVPEMHTAIAAAFGAPLLTFSGETGGCIAFVGPSGVGKTSAFNAGAAVWGDPQKTMISLDDTANYQTLVLGQTRSLPVYWDEAKIATKERAIELVNMLHKLTQGRDKGRLTAEINVREAGDWTTIFPLSTNNSVIELVAAQDGHKSATLVRVLEIEIDRPPFQLTATSSQQVYQLRFHYGHAGRVFAKHIAQNVASVRALVERCKQVVIAQIAPSESEERFYTSMAASIIAGASLARSLGLIDLDVKAVARVLCDAILRARAFRLRHEPKGVDALVKTLEDFCADHMDARVVTATLARRGPRPLASQEPREQLPIAVPKLPTPAFQIAAWDHVIRVDRRHFENWCYKKGLPPTRIVRDMLAAWNGLLGRGPIGAGTAYYVWRTHYFQIPLTGPLAHILAEYPEYTTTGSGSPGQKVVPIRNSGPVSGSSPDASSNLSKSLNKSDDVVAPVDAST